MSDRNEHSEVKFYFTSSLAWPSKHTTLTVLSLLSFPVSVLTLY